MRALLAGLIITGCAAERAVPAVAATSPKCVVRAPVCAELGADAIGQLPLELEVGDTKVSVAEWTTPDERSKQVVGFAAHVPHDVTFTVHAGPDAFAGQGPRWLHPGGVVGRSVHGIDTITFCQTRAVAQCERATQPAVAMK